MGNAKHLESQLRNSVGRGKTVPAKKPVTMPAEPLSGMPDNSHAHMPAPAPPPSRIGKKCITVWLHPDYWRNLHMLRIKHAAEDTPSVQDLVAEALNELFTKYNLPTVTVERQGREA